MNTTKLLDLRQLRAALLLERPAFEQARRDRNILRNGVLLIVVITLIAGLLPFVYNLFQRTSPQAVAQGLEQFRQGMIQGLASASPEVRAIAMQYFDSIAGMIQDYATLSPRLPQPIATFFSALGQLASQPLARLGAWLSYSLWVLLFARLLGGRGSLPTTLGLSAYYVVPHALDMFSFIPVLGPMLGLIAFVWGLAIYTRGVQVAQRFSVGRAMIAVILPAAILAILILFAFFLLILLIALGSRGG